LKAIPRRLTEETENFQKNKQQPKFTGTFSVDHKISAHQKMSEDNIMKYGSLGTRSPVFLCVWVRLWNTETLRYSCKWTTQYLLSRTDVQIKENNVRIWVFAYLSKSDT